MQEESKDGASSTANPVTTTSTGPNPCSAPVTDSSDYEQLLALKKEGKALSKNQIKKLKKHEKWLHKKELQKANRKEERRLKKEKKRKIAIAAAMEINSSQPDSNNSSVEISKPKKKYTLMKDSTNKQKIALDLDFNDYMILRDIKKLASQVSRCYTINRYCEAPCQLYFTGVNGKIREQLLSGFPGHVNWDVHLSQDSYSDLFLGNHQESKYKKEQLVYLTADSPNVLNELDEEKIYIIGGLVDHNVHKDLCYRKAEEQGIEHGCLPIGDYIKLASRKVLAVNHVYEILVKYIESKDWQKAFMEVIPQRKGVEAM